MIPQQITGRKKKYIGNTYLPIDRSTITSNSPPPLPTGRQAYPPPCLRPAGRDFAQAGIKGEGIYLLRVK